MTAAKAKSLKEKRAKKEPTKTEQIKALAEYNASLQNGMKSLMQENHLLKQQNTIMTEIFEKSASRYCNELTQQRIADDIKRQFQEITGAEPAAPEIII